LLIVFPFKKIIFLLIKVAIKMNTYSQWHVNQTAVDDWVHDPVRNPYVQVLTNSKKMPWVSTMNVDSAKSQLTNAQKKNNEQWPLQKFLDTGKSLLPVYSRVSKSANDFSGLSFGRFQSGDGYFSSDQNSTNSQNRIWATTDVQQPRHIIQAESQRGGLHSSQLVKESWNTPNCTDFSFNSRYMLGDREMNEVYKYNSNYCRNIGISSEQQGSMPYPM